jgi:hypothetical protein
MSDWRWCRYALALLDQYNAHTNLNTVTHIDQMRVAEDAREIDRARARGARLGPPKASSCMLDLANRMAPCSNRVLTSGAFAAGR